MTRPSGQTSNFVLVLLPVVSSVTVAKGRPARKAARISG